MAEVLAHPDKDRDFSQSVFHLPAGNIAISTRTGERLTHRLAVLMLEQARQIIIDDSFEV